MGLSGQGQRVCSPMAVCCCHRASAEPARALPGMEFLPPSEVPVEMPPHTLPASALALSIYLSASLWKSSLRCPVFPCSPCFWAVPAPQALTQGTWQWGPTPNRPKQPQNCSHCSLHTKPAQRKNGEIKYSSVRVISFQGQKVAHEFARSAWRSSCDINQKFKTLNFWGAPTPPAQGSSPVGALTFTGGKAASHPKLRNRAGFAKA